MKQPLLHMSDVTATTWKTSHLVEPDVKAQKSAEMMFGAANAALDRRTPRTASGVAPQATVVRNSHPPVTQAQAQAQAQARVPSPPQFPAPAQDNAAGAWWRTATDCFTARQSVHHAATTGSDDSSTASTLLNRPSNSEKRLKPLNPKEMLHVQSQLSKLKESYFTNIDTTLQLRVIHLVDDAARAKGKRVKDWHAVFPAASEALGALPLHGAAMSSPGRTKRVFARLDSARVGLLSAFQSNALKGWKIPESMAKDPDPEFTKRRHSEMHRESFSAPPTGFPSEA